MTPGRPSLIRPRDQVTYDLGEQLAKGKRLNRGIVYGTQQMNKLDDDEASWSEINEELLGRSFSDESVAENYRKIEVQYKRENTVAQRVNAFNDRIARRLAFLQTTFDKLRLIPEFQTLPPRSQIDRPQIRSTTADVFVVHGRNRGPRDTVARFLEKLGLHPIILAEEPNKGNTLVEKLEAYSNVSYAIVIMTPEDLGMLVEAPGQAKPRARQNVILELGYLLAKLGRRNVCLLHSQAVEIPSDIKGMVYVPFDDEGAWRARLVTEFEGVGIKLDKDKIVEAIRL